jgi:hypothetical protein
MRVRAFSVDAWFFDWRPQGIQPEGLVCVLRFRSDFTWESRQAVQVHPARAAKRCAADSVVAFKGTPIVNVQNGQLPQS